jgi:DNA-binding transcriptional ArsR family regulator
MRFDLDLVREILLQVEAAPANQDVGSVDVPSYSQDVVHEHIELLSDRGLIEANIRRAGSGEKRVYYVYIKRLTWEGHDFLENARNEEVWAQTKAIVKEKGGSASFEVVTSLLSQVALKVFGLA